VRAVDEGSGPVLDALGVEPADTPLAWLGTFVLRRTKAPEWTFAHSYTYGIYTLLSILCLLGWLFSMRALIASQYPDMPGFVSDLAPVIGALIIPVLFFRYVSFIYDPMTLFMFAFCFYLIATRRYLPYALVFPLAVLAKSTAIVLPLVLIVRDFKSGDRRHLALLTAYQIAVFIGVSLLLRDLFGDNPGGEIVNQIRNNLQVGLTAGVYVKSLTPMLPLALLMAFRWRTKPAFLRWSFLVVAIPLLGASLLFCALGEMRDYYEVYPLALLLAIPSAVEVFGMDGGQVPRSDVRSLP